MMRCAVACALLGTLLWLGATRESIAAPAGEERFTQTFDRGAEAVFQACLRSMARHYWKLQYIDEANRVAHFRTAPGVRGQAAGSLAVRPGAGGKAEMVVVVREVPHGMFGGGDPKKFSQDFFQEVEKELTKPSPYTESLVFFMVKEAKEAQAGQENLAGESTEEAPAVVTIAAPADKIKAALVAQYAGQGYLVLADSAFQLSLGQNRPADAELVASVVTAGARPRSTKVVLTFALTPLGAQTTVVPQVELWTTNPSGATDRWDVSRNAKLRTDLEKTLSEVKRGLESAASSP